MKNISPISEVLTNVFLNISVSNPAVDVVDAAPNVISNVVDLEGDALLNTFHLSITIRENYFRIYI